jgi:DNA polymerase
MREEYSYGIVVYSKFDDKYKYLFLKRKEGWLDFPKGHIEAGETEIQAALRETQEETGLTIGHENLIPYFHHDITFNFTHKGTKIIKRVRMFLSRMPDNVKITVSREHKGYIWLDYQEAMFNLSFGNQKSMLEYANAYVEKVDKMKKLNGEYKNIYKNRQWNLSTNFVPGEGNLNARICIVGQAPGRNEDIMKRPFVGRSGKLLGRLLEEIHVDREDVYITSIVQFFPPENRAPSEEEVSLCLPFLADQMSIIEPKIIVLLGSTAARALLPIKSVTKEHGKLFDEKYFVTLHPAAALRNPANLEIMKGDFHEFKKILNESS